MSLLNDVLSDLDQREVSQQASQLVPESLRLQRPVKWRQGSHKAMVILLVVLLLLGCVAWFGWQQLVARENAVIGSVDYGSRVVQLLPAPQGASPGVPQMSIQRSAGNEFTEIPAGPVTAAAADSAAQPERAQHDRAQPDSAQPDSAQSDNARPDSAQKNSHRGQITVELDDSDHRQPLSQAAASGRVVNNPTTSAEDSYSGTARVPSLQSENNRGQPSGKSPTAANGRHELAVITGQPSGEASGQISGPTSREPSRLASVPEQALPGSTSSQPQTEMLATNAVVNIKPSADPEAVANRTLNRARKLYLEGNPGEAEQMLWRLLEFNSDHQHSLLQLGNWLLARNAYQKVDDLLTAINHNSWPELRVLKAYSLLALSKPQQALAILQNNPPLVVDHPQWHSLRAGLLQQSGQYAEALMIYAELVEVNPGIGAWWAGLGISLDQTGRLTSAARAYGQALADPELSVQLAHYAEQRIRSISSLN